MKKIWIVGLVMLVLTACNPKTKDKTASVKNEAFETALNEIMVNAINPTDMAINFLFTKPENYNIKPEPYTLDFTDEKTYSEQIATTEKEIETLKAFDPASLSAQQQIDQAAVLEALQQTVAMKDYYDFEVGSSVLGYSRHFLGSLPAYLETFVFRSEADVAGYMNLLKTLPESIQKYIDLEYVRQRNNTGFGKEEIDEIIKVNQSSLDELNTRDTYLIQHFNDSLDASGLFDETSRAALKAEHTPLIQKALTQSYQEIVDGFKTIDAKPSTGLANKPNGKAYYETLLQQETGRKKSIEDIKKYLDRKQTETTTYLFTKFDEASFDEQFSKFQARKFGDFENGESLLAAIQAKFKDDYPAIETPNYALRKVDPSMQASSSPAFYFSPPVDYNREEKQIIYVNGDFDNGLYTTYAHEGLPGHMYQFSYFLTLKDMHPIRSILSPSSSSEGWANYAEKQAVQYVQDKDFSAFYSAYNTLIEIMHVRADIGIHYDGWDFEAFKAEFTEVFRLDDETLQSIYTQIVHTPAAYPTYYLSSLYIQDMKEYAQKELGDKFNLKAFHEAYLSQGAASFDLIDGAIEDYIAKVKKG